jgi:Ca2+-binding EF-hand superfamily protein
MKRIAILVACALTMPMAQADSGERERQIFRALDENRDGAISAAEAGWGRSVIESLAPASASGGSSAPAQRARFFPHWDRNDDGYLSERELWEADVPRGAGWMAIDQNGDGRIARPEFTPVPPP